MKKLTAIFSAVLFMGLVSCNSGQEQYTEETVLEKDTVDAEVQYEVEKKVREKTVEIDTMTETETVTNELEAVDEEEEQNEDL